MTQPKKTSPTSVLLFHPANSFGGAERSSTNIVRLSDPKKLRFVIVAGPNALRTGDEHSVISLFDLGLSNGFGGFRRAWADARTLCAVARREKCGVALGMLHYGALVVVLMRFASWFRIKSIASPRTPSVLGIEFHVGRSGLAALKWRNLVRFFCRFGNRIIVNSNGLKEECVNVFGANPVRVVVIHNGIGGDAFGEVPQPPAVSEARPEVYRIVTVARLAPEKELGTLLSALAIARRSVNAFLVIVGEGPELESLQETARRLGVEDSVEFRGFNADPCAVAKTADIFVHTSRFEGFPNVVLEALACGVPVIATDCDFGPREIIQHGVNGLLVPVAQPHKLAEALVELCNDAEARARMVRNGIDSLTRFDAADMVRAYERTILELAN